MLELPPSLEELKKNGLPPKATFTPKGRAQAQADKKFERSLLNPKVHSEELVKRILQGPIFNASEVYKDGDWVTLVNGQKVFQKKLADLRSSIPMLNRHSISTWVTNHSEVKGVSPGQNFALSRLTKRNNLRQKSQHEKLTDKWREGKATVFLWQIWWDAIAGARPILIKKKSRTYTKWRKIDCEAIVYVVGWGDWYVNILPALPRKSVRPVDLKLLEHCKIYKADNNRWTLSDGHWITEHLAGERQLELGF